jgi:beta-lactamase regulating signal transducer with metallopeptidase domain
MTAADVLEALSRMNLAAGAAILGVVALRKLVRTRFGARLAYGLWLLPVLTSAAVLIPARQVHVARAATPAMVTAFGAQQGVLAPPAPTAVSLDPLVLIVGVWIAGIAVAALIMAGLQLRFMRQARGGALGPALVGVMAPRIVTPKDFAERYSPGEQTLVLAHERTHLERQDSRLNGFCAALQCLCWFNPLVHLGAHLMRIDQELACDEAVVIRFPGARRAYAEVLVKAQLATLPLPLGCYWPSKSAHPLVERIAMLKRKDLGRAHRPAAAVALAMLCVGAAFGAWASQPPEVRITVSPVDQLQAAAALQAPALTPAPATDHRPGPSHERSFAPKPAAHGAVDRSLVQTAFDAAAPTDTVSPPAPILIVAATRPLHVMPAPEIAATPVAQSIPTLDSVSGDPDQILCQDSVITGSHFVRHVCMTQAQWEDQPLRTYAYKRRVLIQPDGYLQYFY